MKQFLLCSIGFTTFAFGQTADMVSLDAGYANESYYSFATGEVANVNNYNWDLAFELSAWGAGVRLNRKNATLYVSPGAAADWATLDTNGMQASWEQSINGYDWWNEGALNNVADPLDAFDIGWGQYNSVTHQIIGSRIFVLKYTSGDYKKLIIESLISGDFVLKHADLNGANEITTTITKSNYSDRNFVYYDVLNDVIVNREPMNTSWDIVFTNYVLELAPGYFGGVTSVLHNDGVVVSRVSGVPTASAVPSSWDTTIATIGYDWKSFNSTTFTYDIVDSLCYFVQLESGDVWKLIFTGFEGSSTGTIHFTKEQVEFAGIPTHEGANLEVSPNPASDQISINYPHKIESTTLLNMNGQIVFQQSGGISTVDVSNLDNGVYFLRVSDASNMSATKKISIQH